MNKLRSRFFIHRLRSCDARKMRDLIFDIAHQPVPADEIPGINGFAETHMGLPPLAVCVAEPNRDDRYFYSKAFFSRGDNRGKTGLER